MVPGFFECFPVFNSDVKNDYRCAGASSQHDRPRFCDVARAAWTVNRERAIASFLDALRHHCKATQSSARRTSLRGAITHPLNHFARPLTVERRSVHHYHAAVAPPPDHGNYYAMPECPNASSSGGVDIFGVLPAQDFKPQRGAQNTNHGVNQGSNEGDLDSAGPRQLREARV